VISSRLRRLGRRLGWRLRPPVLSLGGGGARGFAHIGVLEALDQNTLHPRAMAGTSMGAVIAAMYAALGSASAVRERWEEALDRGLLPEIKGPSDRKRGGTSAHPLLQRARKLRDTIVVAFAIQRESVLDDKPLIQALEYLLPDCLIEDLPLDLCFAATDLDTGEEVSICRGNLREAVKASSSVPGIAPPVLLDGRRLVDGGVVAELPVALALGMGRPVLAVDVSMDLPELGEDESALDTMMRTQLMTSRLLGRFQLKSARWVIRPDVGNTLWSEWDQLERMIRLGRDEMEAWLDGRDGFARDIPGHEPEASTIDKSRDDQSSEDRLS